MNVRKIAVSVAAMSVSLSGTSEGAKKGWETRKGGGPSPAERILRSGATSYEGGPGLLGGSVSKRRERQIAAKYAKQFAEKDVVQKASGVRGLRGYEANAVRQYAKKTGMPLAKAAKKLTGVIKSSRSVLKQTKSFDAHKKALKKAIRETQ